MFTVVAKREISRSGVLGHKRIDYLDQVRALAIVPVMIQHYHSGWLPGGGIGVGIFFALSGFLITTILLEQDDWGPSAAWRFIIRRFMRIYPAYVVAICATVLSTYIWRPEVLPKTTAALYGLLTFTETSAWVGYGFGVLWTLQVEMWFYVLMPLSMLVLGRRLGVIATSLAMIYLSISLLLSHLGGALIAQFGAALAFGAVVSFAWKSKSLRGGSGLAYAIIALSLGGIVVLLVLPPTPHNAWVMEVLGGAIGGCGLISAYLIDPSLPTFGAVAWVGRISYSLYLFHAVVLDTPWLYRGVQTVLIKFLPVSQLTSYTMAFFVSATFIAALSYYFVERPAIRLGARLSEFIFKDWHAFMSWPSVGSSEVDVASETARP